ACKQHDIYVMVDETYVEFADNMDEISAVPLTNYYNNIVILRGTSKFFAAPGLRLGYAITGSRDLIEAINARKNPWTINSLAVVAGETMFTDTAYINETKSLISSERARLYRIFDEHPDFKVYAPSGNFMLVKILKEGLTSQDLFERAIREKMMIRDCSTFPFLDNKYIRFCFMKPEDNDKLVQCLLQ
ncbi:MAG: aminotransferase class I/II-fold pyridoxal phosphate-dependent enzyme, partial [Roseburia sp.]|nr:aminotransferase class I/II-fold pyridoxal phosphate-dependent enzyme [Roseburia sp.]